MSSIMTAVLVVVVAVIGIAAVGFGFMLGRQPMDKPLRLPKIGRTGGQPLFEEDPWDKAREDKPKSEGSL